MTNTHPSLPQEITALLLQIRDKVMQLPFAHSVVLYGSYAKGSYDASSDLDLAVFVKQGYPCHLQEYRQLVRICRTAVLDIQVQAFSVTELAEPCGIVEEIVEFGIDITRL